MNISELCIRRPVATALMTAALVLAGLIGYRVLPVSALPQADFPVISVSATLPGASPDIMATSVAMPLEREFATIAGIDSITSVSGLGTSSITIQFDLDRNIDAAAQDVQAALARAAKRLPVDMTTPPSFKKVNPADSAIVLLALHSPTVPLSTINDLADNILSPRLSQLTGVAQVIIYGAQKYAVRVQIDPDALASRQISVAEVQASVASANSISPLGVLTGPKQQITIQTPKALANAAEFMNLVIAVRDGAPVRLRDVAKVIDSVENNRAASWYQGTRAIVLAIQRQPDANTVDVVDRVKELLPKFRQDVPPTVEISLMNDRSLSIRAAIEDVQLTFGLTVALVVMVILMFLRRFTATLIPAIAMPVSLVATFAVMAVQHFSIDNISLMALTLAVGLVVDDAIVMLENIQRYVEQGMTPFDAAIKGSKEIGFTIVSITVSLVAVFIPILFMSGVVGRMFHEFAVVVTMAIIISAFVSLTLTPTMCARLLRPEPHHDEEGVLARACERGYQLTHRGYAVTLHWVLNHGLVMLGATLATIALTVVLFGAVPKGFFPIEDTGQLFINTEAANDISFDAMKVLQQKAAAIVQADENIATVTSAIGATGSSSSINNGRMFINLKPAAQRPPIMQVIQQLRKKVSAIPGLNVYIQPIQNLVVGGRSSKALYQYVMFGIDQDVLYPVATRMTERLKSESLFQDVNTDLQINAPQAVVDVDRDKAAQLGVAVDDVRDALYSAFGARQISTIYTSANDYQVIIEADPRFQEDASALAKIYVRAKFGALVPLDAIARFKSDVGPLTVNHQSQLPAVTISFNLPPGHALGEAVDRVKAIEQEMMLPAGVTTNFSGTAQVFQQSLANQGVLLGAAVLVIYIVLGMLYESLIHPITILSGLPSAAVGALATLLLFGQDLSVIAFIGILMLIGIVKKNAIMMIDFALSAQRDHGATPREAIEQACLLRFRPIMMTTMAAIMGTLPIALGIGASAELRQPLGLTVVGGLIVSQMLTLYITPVLYLGFERLGAGLRRLVRRLHGKDDRAVAPAVAPAVARRAPEKVAAEAAEPPVYS